MRLLVCLTSGLVLLLHGLPLLAQVDFTSSNLPIVIIDTEGQTIPDEPKVDVAMGVIDNGPGERNQVGDPWNGYDGRIGIEIRGSSSQQFPKRSFAVETRDSTGANRNVTLLGLPEENDWILYAPYSDKTLFRNAITYDVARALGRYASRVRFCELVIDGDYRGVYVLLEKIKRDQARVDITELEPFDVTGDSLTGGYIVKIDKLIGSNNVYWVSPFPPWPDATQNILYIYHDPKGSELAPEQAQYIEDFVTDLETLLDGDDYDHPFLGFYDRVDLSAFVDYVLLNELAKNIDAYRLSTYLYKDRDSVDGRLVAGPAWDFNLAYGNADYFDGWIPEGWQIKAVRDGDNYQKPFWWEKIFDDPLFQNRLACRWRSLRDTVLDADSLAIRVDSSASRLAEAQVRNFERWPILGVRVWPNWFVGATYEEEVEFFENWLAARVAWIDTSLAADCVRADWASPGPVLLVGTPGTAVSAPIERWLLSVSGADSVRFATPDTLLTIAQTADSLYLSAAVVGVYRFRGLVFKDGVRVDLSPVYEYSASEGFVVINEINYNSAAFFDPEDWVELMNPGPVAVDLSGWVIKDDDDAHAFVVPAGVTLEPGTFIVVCRDTTVFRSLFADVTPIVGNTGFGLAGSGDLVRLFDPGAVLVDFVPYDDAPPWPTAPDGYGPTLELLSPELDNALPESWVASSGHGTPGQPNGETTAAPEAGLAPRRLEIELPVPNPFNPATELSFTLRRSGDVELTIYDVRGRLVERLVEEPREAGRYTVTWNARTVASGVYYAHLTVGGVGLRRALVVLK